MPEQARPFWLIGERGVVADGVRFPDGTAVMRWRPIGKLKSTTAIHDDVGSIVAIHGRDGAFRAQWCDTDRVTTDVTEKEAEQGTGYGFA